MGDKLDLDNNFNLNDEDTYGIEYKIYLLSLKYEKKVNEFNDKLKIITNNIDNCLKNKSIFELFIYCDIILKSILANDRLNSIIEISDENISKINNVFIQISSYFIDESFDLITKFIFQIFNFNCKLNKKCFKYKQKYNKILIKENTLFLIIKNCFIKINDSSLKEQLIDKLFFNEIEVLEQNNKKFINKKEYIIETPFLIILLLKILFEIKDYNNISFMFNYLIEIINYSTINTKLLLKFNLLSNITQLIIDLYKDKLEIMKIVQYTKKFATKDLFY